MEGSFSLFSLSIAACICSPHGVKQGIDHHKQTWFLPHRMFFELVSLLQEHPCLVPKGCVHCSKCFYAFGDYWMSSSADVHPFGNLALVRTEVVCMNVLFQDTFCRPLCSRVFFPECFCVLCLSRWELPKTTAAPKIFMQWSLTCATRTQWQTHLITASFLLEKRKEQALSNVLFQHGSPSDPLGALSWVSITSSTPLSSPVDSCVDGRLWKRRSFKMFSKFLTRTVKSTN